MRQKGFLLGLIFMLCGLIVFFVPNDRVEVRAEEVVHSVVFDYNTQYITTNIKQDIRDMADYECEVADGDCPQNIIRESDQYKLDWLLSGYTLEWYVDNTLISNPTTYPITSDTRFEAKWTVIDCYITFDCGGSEDYPVAESYPKYKYNIETTDTFNVAYNYRPTRPCYEFDGWYRSTTYSQSTYIMYITAGFSSYTLYAKWVPIEYTINYNFDGDNTKNPSTYNVEDGIIQLSSPSKEGYVFKGWYSDKNYTQRVTYIDSSDARDLVLYPMWQAEECRVTYILPDGTRSQVICKYGETADLPSELKTTIFQIVKTDVSRHNIKGNTRIVISVINIWWVYLLGLLVLSLIILLIVVLKKKREKAFIKMRKTYQSNSSKHSRRTARNNKRW